MCTMKFLSIIKHWIFSIYVKWIEIISKQYYPYKGKDAANITYKLAFRKNINWGNPRNLIEKINWLQLNTDTSMWTLCADKYKMREYVASKGYADNLPKLYGHWYDVDSIDFDSLPNSFVLKINNGCGTVLVIKNKTEIDVEKVKQKLKKWLSKPFGYVGAQYHYLRIQPCFLAEELLTNDDTHKKISPNSMVDYKVWCINGEPESILMVFDRTSHDYCLDLYDTNWVKLKNKFSSNPHCRISSINIEKPACLTKMLEMAKNLSMPFPEVRVDFYIVKGEPIIGELTFTTGFGYFTEDYYNYLGEKMFWSVK